jgi:tripartite-type tricarboxylate transporter receptor subunit TctC
MMHRRAFVSFGLGTLGASFGTTVLSAQAQSGTLKIVFPFSPGSPGDVTSRLIADSISTALGRNAIVDNRTGADGRLGINFVKNAAPDGNTLLITTGPTMWLMHLVHKAPGFDPYVDFAPVSLLAKYDFAIAVANNTGIKSMPELIAWIKANPAKASYGIPGAGTIPHFTGVRLSKLIGVDMARVVYRGSAPAVNDVISGQIPMAIVTLGDCLQQHRAGTMRMIAVTGAARSEFAPEVPTLREGGVDLAGDAWYALWAPAATPPDMITRYNAATVDLLQKPDIKQRLSSLGLVSAGSTPAVLAAAMRDAAAAWAPVIKETGYTIDQ